VSGFRKRVRLRHHAAKTKFLTIPTAISGIVAIEDDAAVCKEIIEGSIREIFAELSSQALKYGTAGDTEAPRNKNRP